MGVDGSVQVILRIQLRITKCFYLVMANEIKGRYSHQLNWNFIQIRVQDEPEKG